MYYETYRNMKDPINRITELRCGSLTYFGVGAIERFSGIMDTFKKRGIRRAAIITGKSSYKRSGAWDVISPVLDSLGIEFSHYDGIQANPTVDQINEAVTSVKEIEPEIVIGIGGGSVLDSSKIVAVLLKNPDREARNLFDRSFVPHEALPLVLVNLTHGTGSEVDRYAVSTIPEKKFKKGTGFECMYAAYSIDDPGLTLSLPKEQLVYTSIDALNHVVEASTTTITSPYVTMLSVETVRVIAEYLPVAIQKPENIEARYWLMYASALGGIAIDCALVHLTHALEHSLSAFRPEINHGLGLAVLLPAVVKAIYPAASGILAKVLKPIAPQLQGRPEEAHTAALKTEQWIFSMGLREKLTDLGFGREAIPDLVENVRLSQGKEGSIFLAPIAITDELIRRIFEESLHPMD